MLTVVDAGGAAAAGAAGDPRHADGCQWPADDGLGGRDQGGNPLDIQVLAEFDRAAHRDHRDNQHSNSLQGGHFLSPMTKLPGNSAILSCNSFSSIFSAVVEFEKAKSSFATSSP